MLTNGGTYNLRDATSHIIDAGAAWSKACNGQPKFVEASKLECEVEAAKAILMLTEFIGGLKLRIEMQEFLTSQNIEYVYDHETCNQFTKPCKQHPPHEIEDGVCYNCGHKVGCTP